MSPIFNKVPQPPWRGETLDLLLLFQLFFPNFFHFIHPSYGGGGAHKCCSNVINVNKSISIEEWLEFCKKLDINVKNDFIVGIKSEIKRLENFFI